MKAKKYFEYNNETCQEDGMCILCKTGIHEIDNDLIDALKKENQ